MSASTSVEGPVSRTTGGSSEVDAFERHYAGLPGAGWEIGRAQSLVLRMAAAGQLPGPLLDVGCGSGDNAVATAAHGIPTTGVDLAPSGIDAARAKARAAGVDVDFRTWDALALSGLGRRFATVLDLGLLHCFAPEQRAALARSVHDVLLPGGRYVMLAWSDLQPGTWGPRRVSLQDVRDTFTSGWTIRSLRTDRLEVGFAPGWVAATALVAERT